MISFFSPKSLAVKRIIVFGDILSLILSFACAVSTKIALSSTLTYNIWLTQSNWSLTLLLFIYPLVFYTFELYNEKRWESPVHLFVFISAAVVTASGIAAFFSYLLVFSFFTGRIIFSLYCLFSIIFIFCWRQIHIRFILDETKGIPKILLLGSSPVIKEIYGLLPNKDAQSKQNPIIISDYDKENSLTRLVSEKQVQVLVIADKLKNQPELRQELLDLRFAGLTIFDAPYYYELLTGKVPVKCIHDSWFVFHNQGESFNPAIYRNVKKLLDVTLALGGVLITMPLMIMCSLAVKLTSRGPIFFKQNRVGYKGKEYPVYKFRTMIEDAEKHTGPQWASENDPRITKVGKFLRKSHLDELPQFINILRGEMSLVGPRPIRKVFEDNNAKSIPFYNLRHVAKPGVTGWAQVQLFDPRADNGPTERLQYDLFYLRNQSILFDLFIILKTVQTVLFRKGI